ncbi:preprotein translocase subunit SecG [Candidatus Neomarinimicrobiota bacterium]
MQAFLIVLHTIISVLLIVVILMQASQGGGLSGTFGSTATSALLGGRGAGTFLSKLTTYLAVIFLGLAVVISLISSPSAVEPESILKQEAENQSITPGADLSLPTTVPIDAGGVE